jgi:hypothetical protein
MPTAKATMPAMKSVSQSAAVIWIAIIGRRSLCRR